MVYGPSHLVAMLPHSTQSSDLQQGKLVTSFALKVMHEHQIVRYARIDAKTLANGCPSRRCSPKIGLGMWRASMGLITWVTTLAS